jgi:hypothetical protein
MTLSITEIFPDWTEPIYWRSRQPLPGSIPHNGRLQAICSKGFGKEVSIAADANLTQSIKREELI